MKNILSYYFNIFKILLLKKMIAKVTLLMSPNF